MRWEKLELSSRIRATPEERRSAGQVDEIFGPGRRWGHSCNAIQGGKFLYVFGGYCTDTSQTNDVHVFDTVRQIWSKPTMRGIPPSPRDSHSCTTVGNNLFVFGGTDGSNPLKDLHILDTSSNTWISPGVGGEGPAAREGHSASLIDKQIFIFGGCRKPSNSSYEVYYNDLYILDTETLVWKRAVTSGTPPSARDSHTCSSWMNKIIVIGGEDPSGYYLSDVHILDTDTLVWRELSTSGHMLPPRAGHSTVAVGRNLFVFGGFTDARNLYDDLHMFTLDTGVWTNVMAAGQGPCARFSVAGDCLFPQKGVLVFIGGCNRLLEALDDMFYLHTEISMENGQDEQKQEKFSLRKELKRKCHEQCLPVSLPINNKDVPKYETIPDLRLSMPMSSYGQAGKQNLPLHEFKPPKEMRFEAKVIDAFHYGYTIETTIDGKTLRGIIFSHTPGFSHAANDYLSRKRTHLEIGDVKLNDSYRPKLETTRPIRLERIDHRQTDGVHVKESASQESQMETAIASQSNNKMPIDVSQIHVVRENSETSMAPLPEVKNDSKNEPPNASTEIPCDNCSTTDKNMVTAPPN